MKILISSIESSHGRTAYNYFKKSNVVEEIITISTEVENIEEKYNARIFSDPIDSEAFLEELLPVIENEKIQFVWLTNLTEQKKWAAYFQETHDLPCLSFIAPYAHINFLEDAKNILSLQNEILLSVYEGARLTTTNGHFNLIALLSGDEPVFIESNQNAQFEAWNHFLKGKKVLFESPVENFYVAQSLFLNGDCLRLEILECGDFQEEINSAAVIRKSVIAGDFIRNEQINKSINLFIKELHKVTGSKANGCYTFYLITDKSDFFIFEAFPGTSIYAGVFCEAGWNIYEDILHLITGDLQNVKNKASLSGKKFLRQGENTPIIIS